MTPETTLFRLWGFGHKEMIQFDVRTFFGDG